MYGSTIGTLELRAGETIIWSVAGPQGNTWHDAHVALGRVRAQAAMEPQPTTAGP
jgi:hypothetical protein